MAARKKNSPPDENPQDMQSIPAIPDGSSAVGKPATVEQIDKGSVAVKEPPKSRQIIDPSGLAPDLSNVETIAERFKYWIGIHADCPVSGISVAGLKFSKINHHIVPSHETGRPMRSPVIGTIANIDRETMLRLRESLKRIVIRFSRPEGVKVDMEGPLPVRDVRDASKEQELRGRLITIPTEENIRVAKEKGRPLRRYVPHPNDRPAIRWMFMQLCTDQKHGERQQFYPECIEKTGLVWPGEPLPE